MPARRFSQLLKPSDVQTGGQNRMKNFVVHLLRPFLCAGILALANSAVHAVIPAAERLLPADTLLVVSAPHMLRLQDGHAKSPLGQFLKDPAMKPIRDKFLVKWQDEILKPLERELGVRFNDFQGLMQGQFTLAVIQNGWTGKGSPEPAGLLLLDARDKNEQLKKNLADLRRKWVDSGKSLRTETVRGVEMWIVQISSNTLPASLQQLFPQRQEIQEKGRETESKSSKSEIVIAQHESLLIVGSSQKAVETVVARLTGGSIPALADEAAFQANHAAILRDAPVFGWFNAKRFFSVILSVPPPEPNPEAPSPFPPLNIPKIVNATGVGGIQSVALAWRTGREGSGLDLFIGAPESSRVGLAKILATGAKDSAPPPFVPADVMTFQRWRLDLQGTISTLEKMVAEVLPQAMGVWNFILSSGSTAAGENTPGYDIRKDVFGNFGDDMVSYSKPPRGTSAEDLSSPPSILLIGSPNAEKLAGSLKGLFSIVSAANATEREFLGKKVYSISMSRGFMGLPRPASGTLSYAASGGYVAISPDVSLLEEYLRSAETPPKSLRELSGLAEAAQKIGGQGTGLFNYENQTEKMRATFRMLKEGMEKQESSSPVDLISGSIPFAGPERNLKDWVDFSLLPDFDRVAKYFHFVLHTGGTSSEGITYKWFSPTPPQLRE
jgi:hypothetical protein